MLLRARQPRWPHVSANEGRMRGMFRLRNGVGLGFIRTMRLLSFPGRARACRRRDRRRVHQELQSAQILKENRSIWQPGESCRRAFGVPCHRPARMRMARRARLGHSVGRHPRGGGRRRPERSQSRMDGKVLPVESTARASKSTQDSTIHVLSRASPRNQRALSCTKASSSGLHVGFEQPEVAGAAVGSGPYAPPVPVPVYVWVVSPWPVALVSRSSAWSAPASETVWRTVRRAAMPTHSGRRRAHQPSSCRYFARRRARSARVRRRRLAHPTLGSRLARATRRRRFALANGSHRCRDAAVLMA